MVTVYSFPDFSAGFFIEPHVLSGAECEALLDTLGDAGRGRAGARHLMRNPAVAELAMDARLSSIARAVLGAQATPYRATLFEKSGRANWLVPWHQDTALPLVARFDAPGWGPWSEKNGILYAHAPAEILSRIVALRLHLDASTGENGPLRVIPGSHNLGLLTDAEVADYVRTHASYECVAPIGGVLAMRPLLIHASSKARTEAPRRVLHIEYAESLDIASGARLALA